ncbi:hypothetical protein [Hymenobacter aerophilus]|uniref:hypothetical protein n=1 Tax=Hymenobacter aerophilus TaxID=119644 RepID=UPI00036E7811|nr:hypothetical protein [Hymenobacter aerophilus]
MCFRPLLLLALPVLAAACEPALEAGPRVQFVGDSRLTTNSRRLTTPADTFTTRLYAKQDDSPLEHLRITVLYTPRLESLNYNDYPPGGLPKDTLVYLDSTGFSLPELAFQSTQSARTTGGTEDWRYEVLDAQGRTGARSLHLYLFRADSATASYHSYTTTLTYTTVAATKAADGTLLSPATTNGRRFLALRGGLALPGYSVRRQPLNQQRIDLIYQFDNATSTASLSLPTDKTLKLNWPQPRATEIRNTTLDSLAFQNASTPELLRAAFNGGSTFARPESTGPLRRGQVLAFRTPDDRPGLLRVQRIGTTTAHQLQVQVRVSR